MIRPTKVEALDGFRLWLRFCDGIEGEVDLSHLVGRGVFRAWEDPELFKDVKIAKSGALSWAEDIELCSDALYLRLTGKSPEELFPKLSLVKTNA